MDALDHALDRARWTGRPPGCGRTPIAKVAIYDTTAGLIAAFRFICRSARKRLGFCWRCLRKLASKFPGQASRLSKQRARSPLWGRSIHERDARPGAGQIYLAEMGSRPTGFRWRRSPDGYRLVRPLGLERPARHARIFVRRRHGAPDVRIFAAGPGRSHRRSSAF